MKVGVRFKRCAWWVGVSLGLVPSLAWGQVTVHYRTLSLAEAAYLYSGLAMQWVLRASSMRQLPQAIIVCCTIWLMYRGVVNPHPHRSVVMSVVSYWVSCTLILVLFWPEAAPRFLASPVTRVFPGAVTSYVAERNVMTVDDAGASRLVPASLMTPGGVSGAPVPRLTDLLIRVATTVPLTLGESIDSAGLARPFERIPAMREFMDQKVPDELTKTMPDFVRQCYQPAVLAAAKTSGLTFDQAVPWSPIMTVHLNRINIATNQGIFTKLANWWTGTPPPTVSCSVLYNTMVSGVSSFLAGERTQHGTSKQQMYLNTLQMTAQSQARWFVQREMEKRLGDGAAIDVPDQITHLRRAVDALSFGIGAFFGFDSKRPGKSFAGETQKLAERMSRFLAVGAFLVNWAPYITGIAMFTVMGLFPIVLLWSLFPGQHFKPIVNYFLLVIFVCSTPMWWAMVNVMGDQVYEHYKPASMWAMVIPQWAGAAVAEVVVTVLGIIIVPMIQAVLLFGSWRAIGGIWHA